MSHWTDNMIARDDTPRVHDPKPGVMYFASTSLGPMWVRIVGLTDRTMIVQTNNGAIALRRSETTLYLRQPTRTN